MNNETRNDRELVLTREVRFPREFVWLAALTVPQHQNQWWGPDGFKNVDVKMDFRVGGSWTCVMLAKDGTRYPNHVVFKEISPPKHLFFDHGDGERVWFKTRIDLEETSNGTQITIRQTFPIKEALNEVVEKYGAIEGGTQHLAKLDAYLGQILY